MLTRILQTILLLPFLPTYLVVDLIILVLCIPTERVISAFQWAWGSSSRTSWTLWSLQTLLTLKWVARVKDIWLSPEE